MKNSFYPFCFLIVAILPARAGIQVLSSIEDVYYRGSREQAGSLNFLLNADDFADAHPNHPLFMRVSLLQGAVLSETKVDFSDSDPSIQAPIYLPLILNAQPGDGSLNAEPESLSIVRWVAGESEFWLKIQTSSSQWVLDGTGHVGPPSEQSQVSWTLGRAASLDYSDSLAFGANLLFPSRSATPSLEPFADAENTLICLNLANANLSTSTHLALLAYSVDFFSSEAERAPGLFQASTPLSQEVSGDFVFARGVDAHRAFVLEAQSSLAAGCSQVKAGLRQDSYVASFRFPIQQASGTPYQIEPGSYLELELPTDYLAGMPENGIHFRHQLTQGSLVPDLESQVEVKGQTLYRKMRLIWDATPLDPSNQELPFLLEVWSDCEARTSEIQLNYRFVVLSAESRADDAPFTHLPRNCGSSAMQLAQGVWNLREADGDGILPHITRPGGGFETEIILANSGTEPAVAMLLPYLSDGSVLPIVELSLAGNETRVLTTEALFGGNPVSHSRLLEPHSQLNLLAGYRRVGLADAVVAQSQARTTLSRKWRIYAANSPLAWDGLACVNRGAASSRVLLSQFRFSGEKVKEIELEASLAPNAKILTLLGTFFDIDNNSYYELESQQPCALLQLRGSQDALYLWENPAIVVSPQE